MRNSIIAVLTASASLAVSAGEVRITALAVEADTAKAVTGIQSQQIESASSHITRRDNPHGVTAQQIGALTSEADLAALAALATNRVTVLWASSNIFITASATGTDLVVHSVLPSGGWHINIPEALTDASAVVVPATNYLVADMPSYPAPLNGAYDAARVVFNIGSYGDTSVTYLDNWNGELAGAGGVGSNWVLNAVSPVYSGTVYLVWSDLAARETNEIFRFSLATPYVTFTEWTYGSNALAKAVSNAQSVANSAAYDASVAVIDAGNALQLIGGEGGVQETASAHYNDAGIHVFNDDRTRWDGITNAAPASVTNAPAWLVYSNVTSAVTVTNLAERPVRIYGGEGVTGLVSFAALREPLPLYVEIQGFLALGFPGAYTVGGGAWQTNQVNIYQVWLSGTNILVNPITAREIY